MSHSPRRDALRALAALGAGSCMPAWAQREPAQDYPNRPVRLLCPFAPGGGVDITSRAIAQKLTEGWKQSVVVENHPGANGTISVEMCAKSAPDGYTLSMISASHSVNVTLQGHTPYDLEHDLAPISQVTSQPYFLVINPRLPVTNVAELITLARAKPNSINYGSSGVGGFSHLSGALFASMAGLKMTHVPYKGGAPAMADVVTGNIQMLFSTLLESRGLIAAGRLRMIAVSSGKRAAAVPDIPTVAESGLPGFAVAGWYGVVAPAATPPAIIGKLNQAIVGAMHSPQVAARLAADGSEAVGSTQVQFAEHVHSEIVRWRKLIGELGLHPES
jgi:tripartite-type tricarboxylate transporter receptor subunit TctC